MATKRSVNTGSGNDMLPSRTAVCLSTVILFGVYMMTILKDVLMFIIFDMNFENY